MATKLKRSFTKIGSEYFRTITTMASSAFGLVAALAWNEFIKDVIQRFIPPSEGMKSKLLYALAVSLIAVVFTLYLGKIAERIKEEEDES